MSLFRTFRVRVKVRVRAGVRVRVRVRARVRVRVRVRVAPSGVHVIQGLKLISGGGETLELK